MKHRGDGIFSGVVNVKENSNIDGTLHVGGERIRNELHVRGASGVRGINAIIVPTNNVPIYFPRKCSIISAHVVTQGGTGSCTIDVWKSLFSAYPPTVVNSITGGNNLTILSGTTFENTTLIGWDTTVEAGSVLVFNLISSSIFTGIFTTLVVKEIE